jgi:hypothetical protein
MKQKQTPLTFKVREGKGLPLQLEIRNRRVVEIATGEPPLIDMPDGTKVNVIDHESAVAVIDQKHNLHNFYLQVFYALEQLKMEEAIRHKKKE